MRWSQAKRVAKINVVLPWVSMDPCTDVREWYQRDQGRRLTEYVVRATYGPRCAQASGIIEDREFRVNTEDYLKCSIIAMKDGARHSVRQKLGC